jgi:hypothetical protein
MSTLKEACVMQLKMNDIARSTAVIDSQGLVTAIAVRNTQVMSVEGKFGGALNFNGTSDYIDTGQPLLFNDSFTTSVWVQPTDGQPAAYHR